MISAINFQSTNTTYSQRYTNKKVSKENRRMVVLGIGAAGMIIVGAGIACKGNFSKSIAKKGLVLKDNVLINKKTGEKYTGVIKSNVGKIGFNRIESQNFVDGVITEKTYKDAFGKELSGVFYKDGKECFLVEIGYPYFISYNKSVVTYRYSQDKGVMEHTDRRGFTGKSVFEWARNFVKENGWLK